MKSAIQQLEELIEEAKDDIKCHGCDLTFCDYCYGRTKRFLAFEKAIAIVKNARDELNKKIYNSQKDFDEILGGRE